MINNLATTIVQVFRFAHMSSTMNVALNSVLGADATVGGHQLDLSCF